MSDGIEPLTQAQQAYYEKRALHENWIHRLLVSLDQTANVATGGNPDETISAHAARAAEAGSPIGIALCKFLNLFQPDHGPKAQIGDVARASAITTAEEESGGLEH